MESLSRLNIILLHISLLIVGNAINGASAQQCGPPNLVSATPQYNATASSDPLVMNCAGVTLPAMFKWEFNGNIVPSAIEFLYVVQSVMEGGVYRCGYDNINCPGGTIWSTGSITVITQPVISVSTGPVNVMQGDTVTVHCNVTSGYPAPSITWYNGSGDSLGHVSPLTVTAGSNDTLTCIATNTAGYASGNIPITVTIISQTSSSSIQSSTIATSSSSPPSTTAISSSSIATSISSNSGIPASSSSSIPASSSSSIPASSSSSIPASSSQSSSTTIVPTSTSTSLSHSSSFSSSSLTTSIPSIATSVPTPTSTVEESSGGLTTDSIFGLTVTIVFLIFLLASLSFFFAVGVYYCKIARTNKKIRKEKKKREDSRKLLNLQEDIDGEDEEQMAAVAGGVPPSTSYINGGFKEEGDEEEKEEDEEEESDDGSLMNVAIIPKVTIEGQQEVSTNEQYVIKMEKKTKEEIPASVVTETTGASQASNDEVQVVPVQFTAEVEEGGSSDSSTEEEEEQEDAPAAGKRDEPIARKPFLEPQELQELVRNFESFHLEDNAKESIIGKEYKDIPMLLQDISIWPSDTYSKNRYRNVIPNKDTAVMLSGESIADRYINANFIDGYNGMEKAYICAQAPIYDTIPDFWRMIWECNVNTVVMLCGIFEGGKNKCAKYWPPPDTNDTEYYGPFTVRNNYEEVLPFYKVVYISVSINSEEAERDVMLFIFQGWPDFGVPEQAGPILEFQEAVTINHTGGPLLVHCSAGVGRSGTYIAADIGIQQYNAEKTVDPYGTVVKLRKQRGGMIQSFDQYAFLHIVLANYISKNP